MRKAAPQAVRVIGRKDRAILLGVAIAVIAASVVLAPDASGYGTHQRLLMLPCIFRMATHLPCPLCGLTTSFALTARGRVVEAFESNVLGPPLFAATLLVVVVSGLSLFSGMSAFVLATSILHHAGAARWLVVSILAAWPVNMYLYVVQHWP